PRRPLQEVAVDLLAHAPPGQIACANKKRKQESSTRRRGVAELRRAGRIALRGSASLRLRVGVSGRGGAGGLLQVFLDEGVDLAVEDGVGVADLLAGAVVLHQAVGMEDVGADLAAEGDVLLGLVQRVDLLALL